MTFMEVLFCLMMVVWAVWVIWRRPKIGNIRYRITYYLNTDTGNHIAFVYDPSDLDDLIRSLVNGIGVKSESILIEVQELGKVLDHHDR